jgi:hypothetical protein
VRELVLMVALGCAGLSANSQPTPTGELLIPLSACEAELTMLETACDEQLTQLEVECLTQQQRLAEGYESELLALTESHQRDLMTIDDGWRRRTRRLWLAAMAAWSVAALATVIAIGG